MIDRRGFLGLSAAAAAPFIAREALAGALQTPAGDSADPVVVVGAGLAGLRAASVLKDAGRRVIVLEANEYPGGRVRPIRTFGEGLYGEAGAIRIPAAHTAVLTLVRQHGLSVVPFWSSSGSSLVSVGGVTSRVPDDLKALTAPLSLKPDEAGLTPSALLRRYVGQLPAGLSDPELAADGFGQWADYDRVTWPDWLRSRGASPGAVTLMTLGGDSRELSALYVLRQLALVQGTSDFYKIRDGMDQLPRRMGASLGGIVRYNCRRGPNRSACRAGSGGLPEQRDNPVGSRQPRDPDDPVLDAAARGDPAAVLTWEDARDRDPAVLSRDALPAAVSPPLLARVGFERVGADRRSDGDLGRGL